MARTLILGGARSGKSTRAEQLLLDHPDMPPHLAASDADRPSPPRFRHEQPAPPARSIPRRASRMRRIFWREDLVFVLPTWRTGHQIQRVSEVVFALAV